MRMIIKNGTVIDGFGSEATADILIDYGIIKAIDKNIQVSDGIVIDATGKYVLPGFVDMHTHLRQPGFVYNCCLHAKYKSSYRQ